jgi:glycosyltransferase involved in cell wall biosynthesis
MRNRLLITGNQVFEEYALADLILVLSEKAAWSFRVAGVPEEKLFMLPRGTDTERFTPGAPPAKFRAIFVGALIQRKGVHWLLEAWHRLALKDAELVLVGRVHDEIKPFLENTPRRISSSRALWPGRRIITGNPACISFRRAAKAARR